MDRNREDIVRKLKEDVLWDVLVIGGGATGSGIALDASLRGLNVALVEKGDFASCTSSRCTNMFHGGVRYLEKAFAHFPKIDFGHLKVVKEASKERDTLLKICPHLSSELPIITPVYKEESIHYYKYGLKKYHSYGKVLPKTRLLSVEETKEKFPGLDTKDLKASVLYYDGQFNDARMAISIVLSAHSRGATLANYVEVVSLMKEEGKVVGATVRDKLTEEEWSIRAECVINATGPFVDSIRKMDNPQAHDMILPSSGVHILFPGHLTPGRDGRDGFGLFVHKTRDKRVIFVLPWLGCTMAGTTDYQQEICEYPQPTEYEIRYIIEHLNTVLSTKVSRSDVLAAWSGIRPLARGGGGGGADTISSNVSREHVIQVSSSNLISIAGGKWTTYRKMAKECVEKAIQVSKLNPQHKECVTHKTLLHGSEDFLATEKLQEEFLKKYPQLSQDVLYHLLHTYGDKTPHVLEIAQSKNLWERLAPEYPYLEAEVEYSARFELAVCAVDVIARRTRLAFLDTRAAYKAIPRIVELMTSVHNWDFKRVRMEYERVEMFMKSMSAVPLHHVSVKTPEEKTAFPTKYPDMHAMVLSQNVIHGLTNNYVPTGIAYMDESTVLLGMYKTGQFYGKCASTLLAMETKSNTLLKQFEVLKANILSADMETQLYHHDQPFVGRLGGVCCYGNYIWVTQDAKREGLNGLVVAFKVEDVKKAITDTNDNNNAENHSVVRLDSVLEFHPRNKASYLYCEKAEKPILWVGDFVRENTYLLPDDRKCSIVGYYLDAEGKPANLKEDSNELTPDCTLTLEQQNVHGAVIQGDLVILSVSYGPVDGALEFHRVSKLEVNHQTRNKTIVVPSGGGGLDFSAQRNTLLMSFESGSNRYREKWRSQGAYIEDSMFELKAGNN